MNLNQVKSMPSPRQGVSDKVPMRSFLKLNLVFTPADQAGICRHDVDTSGRGVVSCRFIRRHGCSGVFHPIRLDSIC